MFIELDEGYDRHRKTLRLCALLRSTTADIYPPRLWLWAVRSAPDGVLTGMTPEEIEIAVRYMPCDGTLFTALVSAGFLDVHADGIIEIHGWEEHTGAAIRRMSKRADDMKELRAHRAGSCLPRCRHCERTLHSRDANVQRSPVQSSQVKTSQTSGSGAHVANGVPEPEVFQSASRPPEPEAQKPDPKPIALDPPVPEDPKSPPPITSGYALLSAMTTVASRVAPELGMWHPGPFGPKHADEFLARFPVAERESASPEIRRRAEKFFRLRDEKKRTMQNFSERWNELADGPARPRFVETPPDEVELAGMKLRQANRERVAAERAAAETAKA